MLNPLVNGKIQELFKAFECFSSTFQGKFHFQGLFRTVLFTYVLFKPVRTLVELVELLHALRYSVDIFSYSGPSVILGTGRKQNTS